MTIGRMRDTTPLFKKKRYNYTRWLKRKRLIDYLRNELRNCTTHGLPFVVNTELHWFERLFWAVSFVGCIFFMYGLLSAQYIRFIQAPIVTSVEMDYFNWNVSYPAVTLCPESKVDEEYLNTLCESVSSIDVIARDLDLAISLDGFLAAERAYVVETGCNLSTVLRTITSSKLVSLKDLASVILKLDFETLSVIPPEEYARIAVSLFRKFNNQTLTTSTNLPMSIDIAMTEVGLCHVINSNVAVFDDPNKWVGVESATRPTYERTNTELSVHDRDFFTQIMNYAEEYEVYIHSSDEIILSSTVPYTYVAEGYLSLETQVWSTKISMELQSSPLEFRKCKNIDEPTGLRYPIYSYNHCILECRVNLIKNLCGCIPHFYKPLVHERVCNLSELVCISEYIQDITKLSASPSTRWKYSDVQDLPDSPRDCNCLNSCETDVFEAHETFLSQKGINRMRIGIYSYPKVRVVRELIFGFYDFILKFGGTVNLCIGTSFISIMELIVMILRIPIYEIHQIIKYKIVARSSSHRKEK